MDLLQENFIASIFLTLVLSVIGAGVWDILLKPVSSFITKFLYKIFTFGRQKAKNEAYVLAAYLFFEPANISSSIRGNGLLLMAIVMMIFFYGLIMPDLIGWKCFYLETIIQVNECAEASGKYKSPFNDNWLTVYWGLIALICVMLILQTRRLVVRIKIAEIIVVFKMNLELHSADISKEQRQQFMRDFCNMKNPDDFYKIIKIIRSSGEGSSLIKKK
ncbi:hypothetical protein [Sneathiella sp. HT1-7]|uniref:hypothetical protein n=1 Tax=Sneathiella sp. HT1-7 TaxID=2887192 RepID=UPI001D15299A|nr:hypothetical protein [Sneathiella sp. HT1-7]MCC3305913.1 hypothetical protein [Sneathiella sp. HT1-7]